MKKLQCICLAFVLLFTTAILPPAAQTSADAIVYGDGNNDTKVNAADALIVLTVAVGKRQVSDAIEKALDVDGSGRLDAGDALLILKYAVGLIDSFPVEESDDPVTPDNPWQDMTMDEVAAEIDGETTASAITDAYTIHNDGGMVYNPLSREMDSGDKSKYNVANKTTGTLQLSDGTTLTYSVPTDVTAYDMIPVTYSVTGASNASTPVYVEATTFEDQDGSYYDLCLPGKISLSFDYQGYVSATNNTKNRPYLSNRLTNDTQGTQYPQYDVDSLVKSDTVPSGQPVWFKFKITNTGNTILDGDGNGTFCFEPVLKNASGTTVMTVANLYYRLTEDLYPGESVELYIYFGSSSGMSLTAGEYSISINCLVRNEQSKDDWGTKIWGGYNYGTANKAITVSNTPTVTNNSSASYTVNRSTPTRNTWLHTYEEFTTSFDSWLVPSQLNTSKNNVLYVQPAAWSDRLVLKFMRGNSMNMVSATIPLNVETDSISIQLNETASNYIVKDDGTKYPAMASQSMCDMRVNTSLSPYANEDQINELLDMKDCGINLVTTTEAFNIETVNSATAAQSKVSNNADSVFFVSDVLRKLDMRMEGYTGYPYNSTTTTTGAYWYSRDRAVRTSSTSLLHGDPILALANGLRGLYQFMRWGDNYYVDGGSNKVVVNTEDTRGWMRIDFNARHKVNETTIANFQTWLKAKYGTIDALNKAWSDSSSDFSYTSFDEIDPTEGAGDDHGWDSHVSITATLTEWSTAINDWDIYRTIERTDNYTTVLDTMLNYNSTNDIGAASVNATMGIRTEGGNITAIVPYNTTNSHFRHVYYSQRRCAIIPQVLAASGTVSMHSDYVTLPYSVSELETLIASSTALGITSMPLLQSNRMRDIAINEKYGDSNYGTHYNLTGANCKGAYVNTQVSVFQSFKAIYENGGIPGVLWEDYLCDGYITETQQKEMKFYSSKIAEMMATDEAKAWATTNVPDVEAVLGSSVGAYSYSEEYIQQQIDAVLAKRK